MKYVQYCKSTWRRNSKCFVEGHVQPWRKHYVANTRRFVYRMKFACHISKFYAESLCRLVSTHKTCVRGTPTPPRRATTTGIHNKLENTTKLNQRWEFNWLLQNTFSRKIFLGFALITNIIGWNRMTREYHTADLLLVRCIMEIAIAVWIIL